MHIQPKGYLPIYHQPTSDRVEKWVRKNWTTHLVNGGSNDLQTETNSHHRLHERKAQAPLQPIREKVPITEPKSKKGRIRKTLFFGIIGLVLIVSTYAKAWGYLG
ncbi:MAG: hypothetical protein AAF988_07430 [Pseudomonadota bacterium]